MWPRVYIFLILINNYFLVFILDAKISRKVSQEAALNVIKVHKSNMENRKVSKSGEPSTSSSKTITATAATTMTTAAAAAIASTPLAKETALNSNNETGSSHTAASGGASATPLTATANNKVNSNDVVIDNQTQIRKLSDSHSDMGDARPKYRQMNSQCGRTQLQQIGGQQSKDEENESKIEKFKALHVESLLNLVALRELSWSGIPKRMRAITWRLLSGYLPTALERRNSTLERKRANYHSLVEQYFHTDSRDEAQQDTFRQIHIDMPRMNPHVQLFQQSIVQEMFERILFIWAIRHPASGYVQGINDLVTPFFIVFLQECLYSIDACKCES